MMIINDDPENGDSQTTSYTFYVIIINELVCSTCTRKFEPSDWYTTPTLEGLDESDEPLIATVEFMNEQSLLRIAFNKPLIIPTPYIDQDSNLNRILEVGSYEQWLLEDSIDDWVNITVQSNNYENGEDVMLITNYTLIEFNSTYIDILVDFYFADDLSKNTLDPEYIKIELNRGIFSEDFSILSNDTVLYAEIPIQYTQAQLDEFESFKTNVCEPIIYFSIF